MPLEQDNDTEREERIRRILDRLKVVQAEVARLAEEGSERASDVIRGRHVIAPDKDFPHE